MCRIILNRIYVYCHIQGVEVMALYNLFIALLDIVNTHLGQYIFAIMLTMFAFMLFHRMSDR